MMKLMTSWEDQGGSGGPTALAGRWGRKAVPMGSLKTVRKNHAG